MNNVIRNGSWVTTAVITIPLIIFGVPFFLIQFWDSVEHEVPYQVIKITENDIEGCMSDFSTILRHPQNGLMIKKCGKIGKLNQLVFIPETEQMDD